MYHAVKLTKDNVDLVRRWLPQGDTLDVFNAKYAALCKELKDVPHDEYYCVLNTVNLTSRTNPLIVHEETLTLVPNRYIILITLADMY